MTSDFALDLTEEIHKERLEKLANSDEFKDLEKQLTTNNARFSELKPATRLAAIYLMNLEADYLVDDLNTILYTRNFPTIEEFLTNDYLGVTGETIYPTWEKELKEHFQPNNSRYEIVVGGSIGSGKTTFTNIGHLYNLIRITSLREPQLSMGSAPTKPIALALFSITIDKAEMAVVKPFKELLADCPLFEKVRKTDDFEKYNNSGITPYLDRRRILEFPNNIIVIGGSTSGHALSLDLFGASLDEAEFRLAGLQDAISTYENLKQRIRSRFLGSRFTFLTLISSAKYTTGVIADYIKNLKPDDPETKFISYPIWEVKTFDAYSKGHFYVMRGTQSNPSHILDENQTKNYEKDKEKYPLPTRCKIIKVPEPYRKDFETNIVTALQNLAGVQTFAGDHPFDDLNHIEFDFLVPEFNLKASIESEVPLIQKLPESLFKTIPGGKRLARYPSAPRYIHLDMAETAEAGLAMIHKEFLKIEGEAEKRTIFVVDFVCWITSPDRISFNAVQQLIIDLVKIIEVPVERITTDQFQSSQMRERFIAEKLTPESRKTAKSQSKTIRIQSVDKTKEPYSEFSRIVATNAFAAGKCSKLKKQMQNIRIDEKDKIVTTEKKDMADAVCGAVHGALMTVNDESIYPFIQKIHDKKIIDNNKWKKMK